MDSFPSRVQQTWEMACQLNERERLLLAKALLDSVIASPVDEALDWQNLSLTTFAAGWDNPDDAIYNNWREHYNG